MPCDLACFEAMGFHKGQSLKVRDLWQHKAMAPVTLADGVTFTPDAKGTGGGGSTMFRFSLS